MKVLIIQTAFLGDVILATPIIEKLKQQYPESKIDFLLRKGNESVILNHPHLNKVLIFDKQKGKYQHLIQLIKLIRTDRYDYVININRFFTAGLITSLSGAKNKIGFNKSPFANFYTISVQHHLNIHEVSRNLSLIESLTNTTFVRPKLYPSEIDFEKVKGLQNYVCIAPATLWFTKQLPIEKWCELINKIPQTLTVYLIGSDKDINLCEQIMSIGTHHKMENMAGKFSILQSAALIKYAKMTFANDSTPVHLASSMNAPVTAIYCSTLPAFGFTPVSDNATVIEVDKKLACRPCGLHGKTKCKEGHFACADINIEKVVAVLGKSDL